LARKVAALDQLTAFDGEYLHGRQTTAQIGSAQWLYPKVRARTHTAQQIG
jgi:hypothetical protein